MNKFKLFVSNFLVYGISGIMSKIIPLIMFPVIVNLFPSSEYIGINDMVNTIESFAAAIAILGMYDSMFRMFFENNDDKYRKEICSTTLFFVLVNSIVVFTAMIVFRKYLSIIFLEKESLSYIVIVAGIITIFSSLNSIVTAPTRMMNERKIYLIINVLTPILTYAIAIPLIINGHYVIALPLSTLFSSFIIDFYFLLRNKRWFRIDNINIKLLSYLLKISIPIFPSFILYWVMNSCDKLAIVKFLSLNESGIFAVASKFGNLSQLIYIAFAGGWQYFAFSTMKEDKQIENNSKIFEYLESLSFISFAFVCYVSSYIFFMFFPPEYSCGSISAVYLFLAPLIQMLYQIVSNQFLIVKKTYYVPIPLIIGTILNILLNTTMVPRFGIEGAAAASLISYILVVIICVIMTYKLGLFVINKRMIVSFLLVFIYFILWRYYLDSKPINAVLLIALLLIYMLLYRKEIESLISIVLNKFKE